MTLAESALGGNAPAIPADLLAFPQFVVWRLEQYQGEPKPRKIPYSPLTGKHADSTDPTTWGDHQTALAAYRSGGWSGIGFVFSDADPFVFVDLDDCRQADGQWNPRVIATMAALPGAWEISQSGKGLHGVGYFADKTAASGYKNKWTDSAGNRNEFYATGRFMAIGGGGWSAPVVDWTHRLPLVVPRRATMTGEALPIEWRNEARPDWEGPADDDELIKQAMGSRSALQFLGAKVSFADLWHASMELGQYWPDEGGKARAFDHSSADLALANALAWWTGCNPVRMLRLFQMSALWRGDERKARMAIEKAIADPARTYRKRRDRLAEDAAIGEGATPENLPTVLTLSDAMRDFVFVAGGSHVIHRPSKRARFLTDANNDYSASQHEFDTGQFDNLGMPKIKRMPVVKAWMGNIGRLTVDAATWQPGNPEFCPVLERSSGGDRAYNLWVPPTWLPAPPNWREWVKPFIDHVAYLVPIDAERAAFLCWIAHMFQRPGELPHSHYLMVTEQTGTGRGTLGGILARALRGYVAINMDPEALFGGFNGRISQKLLATVDEIREGNSTHRYEKAETLKSKITEETRAINPKYGMQTVEKNCCRWLMFSNHMDALPFENNDRRIVIVENPSTRAQPEWYAYLHGLMNETAFIASVQQWALSHDISAYSPHTPAPMNDAKRKALAALESPIDAACRQFAAEWPDDIAALSDLASFIGVESNDRTLKHARERAGMKTGDRVKSGGRRETLLVVRGPLTVMDYGQIDNAVLMNRIITARGIFSVG